MPSVFTHAVVALALGPAFRRAGWPARLWWAGALCAVLPDADVVGVYTGVPLGSVFGHRGLTHSLAFAAALAAVLTPLLLAHGAGRGRLWCYLFLATASGRPPEAATGAQEPVGVSRRLGERAGCAGALRTSGG